MIPIAVKINVRRYDLQMPMDESPRRNTAFLVNIGGTWKRSFLTVSNSDWIHLLLIPSLFSNFYIASNQYLSSSFILFHNRYKTTHSSRSLHIASFDDVRVQKLFGDRAALACLSSTWTSDRPLKRENHCSVITMHTRWNSFSVLLREKRACSGFLRLSVDGQKARNPLHSNNLLNCTIQWSKLRFRVRRYIRNSSKWTW